MKKPYFSNISAKRTKFLLLFTIFTFGYIQSFASVKNEDKTIVFKSNLYSNLSNAKSVSSSFDTNQGQINASKFWKSIKHLGKPIDRAVVVELYKKAGDFSVIHALLKSGVISSADSETIGTQRAKMHTEALESVALSGKFGKKIGVNDFGSGQMTAKSDIDFTLYPGTDGVDGSQMIAAYKKYFKNISGGLDPSVFDLVAHRYEATIPDWRQASSSSEFAATLRKGSRLLKSNSEAYFLEGAYINQIMARSVDPKRKTFTWIKNTNNTKDGLDKKSVNVIESDLPFFFHPGSRERYAFGSAVGNWHFYHHTQDKVAQAKYLLRSINGSKATLGSQYIGIDFEMMPHQMQLRLVDKLYGHMFQGLASPAQKLKKQTLLATIQTAAKIRLLKDQGNTSLGMEAYQPLMDLERSTWPKSIPVDDATLLKVAKSHLERYWPTLLVENNIRTSKNRLSDWLSPPIKIGDKYTTLDKYGKKTTINIDAESIKRLQFSAFFELKDAVSLMTQDQINRIKKANPKVAHDIEILQGIYATETSDRALKNSVRKIDAPVTLDERLNNFVDIKTQIKEIRKKYNINIPQSIENVSNHKIPQTVLNAGSLAVNIWNKFKIGEEWLQERAIDKFLIMGGGEKYLPALYKYRGDVKKYNEKLANPNLLLAADYGTSLIKILDAYVVDGEMSPAVQQVMYMELVLRIPVIGSTINLYSNPLQAGSNIIFAQLIPGYGPANIAIQLAVEGTKLAGHIVFVPLQRDKVLMAYQGYLDPEEAGVFLAGRKERQESPRPALLLHIAPDKNMPLNERRKKVYDYFFDNVRQTINGLSSFDYNEEFVAELFEDARNHPGDKKIKAVAERAAQRFSKKEMEVLKVRIRQYVKQWWTATGVFSGYDEILGQRTAGLTEKQFLEKLEALLLKDYYTGKNLSYQEQIDKEKKIRENILMVAADIALAGHAIDKKHSSSEQVRTYDKNGQMILADTLDNMPAVKSEIKIWAIPVIDKYAFNDSEESPKATSLTSWATVSASEKEHPQPWRIIWETDNDNKISTVGDEFSMDLGNLSGIKQLNLTATAYDADEKKIAGSTLRIPIETIVSENNQSENNESENKPDVCKEKFSVEIENLVKEIESIKEFSEGEQGKCAEIKKLLDKQQEQITLEKKAFSDIKTKIKDFVNIMKSSEKTKEKLEENDKKLETLATEIENILTKLGEFSLKICKKTKTLNDYNIKDSEHENTSKWIQKNKKELKIYMEQVKERYIKIEFHKNKIMDVIKEHKTVELKEIEMIEKSIQKMSTLTENINATIAQAEEVLFENLKNVSIIYSRKQAVKKSLKKLSEKCGEEFKNEIKALYARVSEIDLSRCSKGIEGHVKILKVSSSKIKKEIVVLNKKMGQSKKQYKAYTEDIKKIQSFKKNRKIILLLVDNYLIRAKRFAIDGALCVVLSEDIMKKVFIPDVVGMKLWIARRILSKKGLNNISTRKIGKVPSEDLVENVLAQKPQTIKRVKKETQIRLTYYGNYLSESEKDESLRDELNEVPLKDEDCSDTKKQKYSDGKYHTQKALQHQIETINKRWQRTKKRIIEGTLRFHGKVPPGSNYPRSKKEYEKAIEKAKKAINEIHRKGAKQYFSISRAPTSGEWGYSLEKLQEGKAKSQKKLTEKLSPSTREYYSNRIVRSDVMIDRWKKKKIKVLKKYQDKISNSQKMIALWEQEAEKLHRMYLEKVQKIKELMAEHECKQRKSEKSTSVTESSKLHYGQCPKQNPTSKYSFKIDINNNSNDKTYMDCIYFNDNILRYQKPYIDGKLNGKYLKYTSSKPHPISEFIEYKNDLRDGISIHWVGSNAKTYRRSKVLYSKGKIVESVTFNEKGSVKNGSKYRNGKIYRSYDYGFHGQKRCYKHNSFGLPTKIDCK